jgi:carbon-monoxide dehydrogenase medium subunit
MKTFEYVKPNTLAEAISALDAGEGDARALSGGTDLIVQMRAGRNVVGHVVDIKGIPETNVMSHSKKDGLTIGSSVPCYRIYNDQNIKSTYAGLVDSVSIIGGTGIQGRASLGGNLCNAAPSGDGIQSLIILGAVADVAGPNGTRQIPAEDFCTAPGQNALNPGELLVSLTIPEPESNAGAHYLRFIPRNEMDIAVVGVGASVVLDSEKKSILSARISLASVAPTPLFVETAGDALKGTEVASDSTEKAAVLAQEAARPIDDMRGTAEYRRHLVSVLTKRALKTAIERAQNK